jgi:hypothetical protein
MTKLATSNKKLNEVLAHEYAPESGYCRKTATVTVETGMDVGAVVVLAAGKYVWVEAADVATLGADVAVVIEAGFGKDMPNLTAGDHALTLLVAGPSGVKSAGLQYKDTLTTNQKAPVQAALAAKGIKTFQSA